MKDHEGRQEEAPAIEASDSTGMLEEISDAVDDTGHAIRDRVRQDASRLGRLIGLFRQGSVAILLALHLGATAILTAIVFSESFPYPYMYLAMGLLLWGVFSMRFRALGGRKYAAATRSAIVNVLLTGFWLYILIDQIPGRPVVLGSLRMRPDVATLWIPVAIYAAAQVGMIVHGILDRRHRS